MTVVEPPSIPERIGRYRVLGELGRGAMGRVYVAYDPNVERRVALKLMSPVIGEDPEDEAELRHRFLLEARAAGRLAHPGIVAVHDADTDPGSGLPFIAMELVEGESLESLLRREGRLAALVAVDLVAGIARALDYAHARGVIHRDVKPANILLAAGGGAKIADFGIAKLGGLGVTRAGRVLGSPYFMSPEQVQGLVVDGRSDLFSLGAVLYRALTGELPFPGDGLVSVAFKVVQVDPRPLDPGLGLPASVGDLLTRAMAKEPSERFASAAEMAEALEALARELAGALDMVTPPLPVRRATPPGGVSRSRPISYDRGETLVLDGDGSAPPTAPTAVRVPAPGARERRRSLWLAGALVAVLALAGTGWVLRSSAPAPPSVGAAGPRVSRPLVQPEGPPPEVAPTPTAVPEAAFDARNELGPRYGDLPSDSPAAGAAAGEPKPLPTPQPTAAAASEERAARRDATLHLAYRNRLGSVRMTVLVDGEVVWSQELEASANPLTRAFGDEMLETVKVPSGDREVEVRVRGRSMDVDASARLPGHFDPGGRRWLRITLNPFAEKVTLAWAGE